MEEPSLAEAQLEAYDGPKARIAVSRFTDKTGKGWWTGRIGDGMADMLTTALFNTNRFIVLERQSLQDVLAEQDLGASGRIRKETAAAIGEIEGAELLVTGAITEFEPGSGGIGGGIGGTVGRVIGGVLAGMRKSHIAIDLRVIDTRTSQDRCCHECGRRGQVSTEKAQLWYCSTIFLCPYRPCIMQKDAG